MSFKPISSKWNIVDTVIFKIENAANNLINSWKESREPEPDVEEIIAAETQFLKSENEKYKKMQYPTELIIIDDKKYCPECNIEIPNDYYGKCCFDCGQRIKRKTIFLRFDSVVDICILPVYMSITLI